MFALIRTAATINAAQLQGDIIGLLTGSITTPAGLSASCVAANSNIISNDAPGWSLHDAAAGAVVAGVTPKVIKAPWADSINDFKYIKIDGNASAVNLLTFNGHNTWNATTHVGTLPHVVTPSISGAQALLFAVNGWLIVSSTANHYLIAQCATDVTLANFGAISYCVSCFDYSRDDAWSTVANGYPSWLTAGEFTTPAIMFSKLYNVSTAVDSNSVAIASGWAVIAADIGKVFGTTISGLKSFAQSIFPGIGSDATKTAAIQVYPLAVRFTSTSAGGGYPMIGGSLISNSVLGMQNIWNTGDEVDMGGQRYFRMNIGTASWTALLIKEA